MIAAVILAAGRSSRMGTPKAFLLHRDGVTTFIAYVIATIRRAGVERIAVVGRPDDAALKDEVERCGAAFVTNPDPDRGQLSSLVAGLDVAEAEFGAEAVMVLPVDVPLVTVDAIRMLLERATTTSHPIVRATAAGQHGHPVVFRRSIFPELRAADPAQGARAVVRADPARVADVDVGDRGTLIDVDTPDDYRDAFGRSF